MIHGAIVSIRVAINSTNNVDIITGSLFSSLQFTDVLSANAYWLLTTWWSKQGLYNAGKLRSVYYSLSFISHQEIDRTVLCQGHHGQFLVSVKQPGLDIWKKSLLNDQLQYYLFLNSRSLE